MKILIFGDTSTWNISNFSIHNISQPIRQHIASADLVIYNLEGPIKYYNEDFKYRQNLIKNFFYKKITTVMNKTQPIVFSHPNILDLININKNSLFTLANNHIKDIGKNNLVQTVKAINNKNAYTIGYAYNEHNQISSYSHSDKFNKIKVFNYNFVGSIKHKIPIKLYDVSSNSYGACHKSFSQIKQEIKNAQKNKFTTILILHMGNELKSLQNQQIPFKHLLKLQSNITIIHHPHIYLPSQYELNNIFILGDFIFSRPKHLDPYRPSAYLEVNINNNLFQNNLITNTVNNFCLLNN